MRGGLILTPLLVGCSLTFGDLSPPACATNADCEVLNAERPADLDECHRYQCEASRCTLALLDLDDDQFVSDACGGRDCDDADPEIHPLASDVCGDGVDNDCRHAVDDLDGDGFPCDGVPDPGELALDCDDLDPTVFPGAPEICDGENTSCRPEGEIVEDGDGDGYVADGAMCSGGPLLAGDCDDEDEDVFPGAPEACNGRDDDCDGMVDNADDLDRACADALNLPVGRGVCAAGFCEDLDCPDGDELACDGACAARDERHCAACGDACLPGASCVASGRSYACSIRVVDPPAVLGSGTDLGASHVEVTRKRVFVSGAAMSSYTWGSAASMSPGGWVASLDPGAPAAIRWLTPLVPADGDEVELTALGLDNAAGWPHVGGRLAGAVDFPEPLGRVATQRDVAWAARLRARQGGDRVTWFALGGDETDGGNDFVLDVASPRAIVSGDPRPPPELDENRVYLAGLFRGRNRDLGQPDDGAAPAEGEVIPEGVHVFVSSRFTSGGFGEWDASYLLRLRDGGFASRAVAGIVVDDRGRVFVAGDYRGRAISMDSSGVVLGAPTRDSMSTYARYLIEVRHNVNRSGGFLGGFMDGWGDPSPSMDEHVAGIAPAARGVWLAGSEGGTEMFLRRYAAEVGADDRTTFAVDWAAPLPSVTSLRDTEPFVAIARDYDVADTTERVVALASLRQEVEYPQVGPDALPQTVASGWHLLVVEDAAAAPRLRAVVHLGDRDALSLEDVAIHGRDVWIVGSYDCSVNDPSTCPVLAGTELGCTLGCSRAAVALHLEL